MRRPSNNKSDHRLEPDDAALFRESVGAVKRVTHEQAELRPTPPAPHARLTAADAASIRDELMNKPLAELELELGDPLSHVRDGVAPRILRRLGKGQYSVRDTLDLHDMTAAVATEAIALFLDENRRAGRLCVKIIHGKGLRSKTTGPVLKGLTDRLLRQRGDVLAFRSARAMDGGSGAVIVLLRPSPKSKPA
jgi:DNA-nicking Smr family endonuclease